MNILIESKNTLLAQATPFLRQWTNLKVLFSGAIGSYINNAPALSLQDSVTSLWNPPSPYAESRG